MSQAEIEQAMHDAEMYAEADRRKRAEEARYSRKGADAAENRSDDDGAMDA